MSSLVADDLPRQDVVRSSSPPLPPSRTDAMDTSRSEGINTGSQPLPLPLNRPQHPQAGGGLQSPQDSTSDSRCGLCGGQHGGNPCHMTNSSQNLAQYRYMLLVHAGDEPLDERVRLSWTHVGKFIDLICASASAPLSRQLMRLSMSGASSISFMASLCILSRRLPVIATVLHTTSIGRIVRWYPSNQGKLFFLSEGKHK